MAHHEQGDGWPLGLQPLNVRIGLVRNRDFSGSVSFNTLLTASSCSSTDFSSELDTESSVGSFFHDRRSITLGSLIGVSSIIDLSRRSSSIRTSSSTNKQESSLRQKKSTLSRVWFFSLCSKHQQANNYDANETDTFTSPPSSLAHFLEAERRATAASDYMTRIQIPSPNFIIGEERRNGPNSLFVNGYIAPPMSSSTSPWLGSEMDKKPSSLILSCICGQANI